MRPGLRFHRKERGAVNDETVVGLACDRDFDSVQACLGGREGGAERIPAARQFERLPASIGRDDSRLSRFDLRAFQRGREIHHLPNFGREFIGLRSKFRSAHELRVHGHTPRRWRESPRFVVSVTTHAPGLGFSNP